MRWTICNLLIYISSTVSYCNAYRWLLADTRAASTSYPAPSRTLKQGQRPLIRGEYFLQHLIRPDHQLPANDLASLIIEDVGFVSEIRLGRLQETVIVKAAHDGGPHDPVGFQLMPLKLTQASMTAQFDVKSQLESQGNKYAAVWLQMITRACHCQRTNPHDQQRLG